MTDFPLPIILASLALLFLPHGALAETTTPNTGDQHQSFTFGYTASSLVLPIIPSCPTPLSLSALTPANNGGPDPVAPYTLVLLVHEQLVDGAEQAYERIYTGSLQVGDMSSVRDIAHPWGVGTQFIGCVWAANGVSGGCQDLTTVVTSNLTQDAYANATSQCRNGIVGSWVTPANRTLDVAVSGVGGTISQNAWPTVCSDLKFTPKNGTPPYTLLIAPAAHPPVNITSASSGDTSMNYTIRLTHGQAFMAAVFDSAGNSFAYGPLHSGTGTDLSCLAVATGQQATSGKGSGAVGVDALAGGVAGAFVVGAVVAWAVGMFFGRRRKDRRVSKAEAQAFLTPSHHEPYADPRPASYRHQSQSSSLYQKVQQPSPALSPLPYNNTSTPPPAPANPYDTPSTLYDSPPSTARAPPNSRPFPRPPPGGGVGYKASSGVEDFGSNHQRAGSGESSRTGTGTGTGTGAGAGHARGGSSGSRVQLGGERRGSYPRRSGVEDDEDEGSDDGSTSGRRRRVYVVHSDGGGGDLHIQLPDSANVIELPPNYRPDPHQPARPSSLHTLPPGSPSPGPLPGSPRGVHLPYLELQPVGSRGSMEMSAEERRARAEAALAEKARGLGSPSPRFQG